MGAISAAVTALAADLTREEHRTKVMAMIGSSIGLVFALSLVGAPLLYGWIGMGGIVHHDRRSGAGRPSCCCSRPCRRPRRRMATPSCPCVRSFSIPICSV
jgi:hypothetical protein